MKFLIVVSNFLRREEGHRVIIKKWMIELKITVLINIKLTTKRKGGNSTGSQSVV